MALHFKDAELDRMVRSLARRRQLSLTDAVKFAVRRVQGEPDAIPLDLAKAIDGMLFALAPLKEQMNRNGLKSRIEILEHGESPHARGNSDPMG
ncbi:type II toxin-antitoxin system VapB family antitoxin [Mesorhizobium sp. 8]|uniref:type II toxin-antitoxin system VapB family antitoxin n=1 Tax=Mesorhizobium sp. 8 TaxID=2584466 RepID=UPI001121C50D|nr:type II toxin-antitoxin system VapB family antitoxin [Mesorhizobium sp. 8]QDC00364.1 hypothetical protein FGU64_08010 [Mesorhizobium sp. 8]